MDIFDEATLRKLEQLTLVADQVRVGVMKGDRRSSKRGTSIEFADYRNYTRGDDLRRLDWNVYARLQRPFIKLLEEEEDLAVHLLVDSSASMAWPEDEALNKLRYAARLTAALGHIGLAAGDLVSVSLLGLRDGNGRSWGPYRGQANTLRLLQFLETAVGQGQTNLNLFLRDYALRARRPGLLFLISDLLTSEGIKEGLNALQSRGYEIGLIHLLSPDEMRPDLIGDLQLVDIETGQDTEITLDATTRDLYQQRLNEWLSELATHCGSRGIHYIPIITDQPWEKLVLRTLRVQGLVK